VDRCDGTGTRLRPDDRAADERYDVLAGGRTVADETLTGTASMGMAFAKLPSGATLENQTLWGSIGWATPPRSARSARPSPPGTASGSS